MNVLVRYSGYMLCDSEKLEGCLIEPITNYQSPHTDFNMCESSMGDISTIFKESCMREYQTHVEISNMFPHSDEYMDENIDLAELAKHFDMKTSFWDRPLPEIGQKYKHFKGNVVEIVCIASDTEFATPMIIYNHEGRFWARPLVMFMSEVDKEKYPDITQQYRFELIEE